MQLQTGRHTPCPFHPGRGLGEAAGTREGEPGGFPGKCPQKGRGSAEASSSPFPKNYQERTEVVSGGQVLPVVASLRAPEASSSLSPAWERLQRETRDVRERAVGKTGRPSARKELPLSGKDFDARAHPLHPALPRACASASGSPGGSLAGAGGGDRGPILIRGTRWGSGAGGRVWLRLALSLFVSLGLPAEGPNNLCKRPSRNCQHD